MICTEIQNSRKMSKVLSSINFLFLTSLGVSSWAILCYFKEIEGRRKKLINVSRKMGNEAETVVEPVAMEETGPIIDSTFSANYDMVFHFLYIFACIYALAKVTSFTEDYISRRLQNKLTGMCFCFMTDCIAPLQCTARTIHDYQLKVQNLQMEIIKLKEQNDHLITSIKVDSDKQRNNVERNRDRTDHVSELDQGHAMQNVCKSNHFHFENQVYVNEGNTKLHIQTPHRSSHIQIWEQYLKMQRNVGCADSPFLDICMLGDVMKPTVMSVEDI